MKHLETLVRHMEWLIELQRDADVQDAIGWVIAENARLRKAIEGADFHPEYCATVFKEPCDCGFEQWKRNALEGK